MKRSEVKQHQSSDAISERVLGQNSRQTQKEGIDFRECMQSWKQTQNRMTISIKTKEKKIQKET